MASNQETQYAADLDREDDVGLILRGHLHIEHQLTELISVVLPQPESCDWAKISFGAKVELASACGLPSELTKFLKRIGAIRNDFAHKLDAALSKSLVLDLYNSMGTLQRDSLKKVYALLDEGDLPDPSKLDHRELFIVLLIHTHFLLKAAIAALELGPNNSFKPKPLRGSA